MRPRILVRGGERLAATAQTARCGAAGGPTVALARIGHANLQRIWERIDNAGSARIGDPIVMHPTRVTPGVPPPVTDLIISEWEPIAAVHGTGSILLGPHDRGAQAIVPPGVLARTPPGEDDDYSERGWRLSVWEFRDNEPPRVGAHRPCVVWALPYLVLAGHVAEHAPGHVAWLRRQTGERLQTLQVLIDHAAVRATQLAAWRGELDDLLLDATSLFGQRWAAWQVGGDLTGPHTFA